jgi:diphosphoinositol-polyphosphate diphosphatase
MTTPNKMTQILSPDPKSGLEEQQQTNEEVEVDLSNMIGRIKPKPVCVDVTLKQQSMRCDEISKFVFATDGLNTTTTKASLDPGFISVVSSNSSTASREMSDATMDSFKSISSDTDSKVYIADSGFWHRKGESERINQKVKTQTISRNGRQTQRWKTNPATHILYRMTTGCIPVLKDGKVILCSASRKPEWILPKGGWEKDEAMEESAIRETFEEAGVFGIIGPTLSEIEFETRKGKKRRIEFEEVQRKAKQIREAHSASPKAVSQTEEVMTPPTALPKNRVVSTSFVDACRKEKIETEKTVQGIHNRDLQMKTTQPSSDGENVSVASETSLSHSHVKMTLFPLYVTEVMETWPEQGRFRKVVDIDEAIQIAESRPYFQKALKELKERNLHIPQELQPLHKDCASSTDNTTTTTTMITDAKDR